jgi:GH24 family phage-related lysozyme (muramidase)
MFMSSVGKLRLQNREKKMVRYYDDMGRGKGNCTVGYGHLVHKNPCSAEELARAVSEDDIMDGFSSDVEAAETIVNRNINVPLTQEQFDALVSYTFNRGPGGAHAAFKLINDGEFEKAAAEISKHVTATVKKKGKRVVTVAHGLFDRRAEESAPFRKAAKTATQSTKK